MASILPDGTPILTLHHNKQVSSEVVEKSIGHYRSLKASFPKLTFETACDLIQENKGFEGVSFSSLKRWVHKDDLKLAGVYVQPKKRGRIVNDVFEREVIHQLFVTELLQEQDGKPREVIIVANAAFTYEMFKVAAKRVQSFPEFADDENVQGLTFSECWVNSLRKRAELRRRATTTHQKPKPSVEEVRAKMKVIQDKSYHHNK